MTIFKKNDKDEILYRVRIIDDELITSDFTRHLTEQHGCINGNWMLTAQLEDQPPEPQLELWFDVPERAVEKCMATVRKAGLRGQNEGRISADDDEVWMTNTAGLRVFKKIGVAMLLDPSEFEDEPYKEYRVWMFSRESNKHWNALMNAHNKFMFAVGECSDSRYRAEKEQRAKMTLLNRQCDGLGKAMQNCNDFIGRVSGLNDKRKPPGFKSAQDHIDCYLLAWFNSERAMPFIEFWNTIFIGGPVIVNPDDIPRWYDDDMCDFKQ